MKKLGREWEMLEAIAKAILTEEGINPKCYEGVHPLNRENDLWDGWIPTAHIHTTSDDCSYVLFYYENNGAEAAWFVNDVGNTPNQSGRTDTPSDYNSAEEYAKEG